VVVAGFRANLHPSQSGFQKRDPLLEGKAQVLRDGGCEWRTCSALVSSDAETRETEVAGDAA